MPRVTILAFWPSKWRRSVAGIVASDVEHLARMAGLSIDAAYLDGVAHNLDVLLQRAASLMEPPLAAEIEPAPVFRP